jgi:hypothetical protein
MESSRAVRRFTDSALGRAVNHKHANGGGWAEAHLQATNFGLPTERVRPISKRPTPDPRNEVHGATYAVTALRPGDDRHAGDPLQIALREPPGYEHPQPLGPDVLNPGGPRILPVTQEITHGPTESRSAEFQEAAELGALHASLGFYDRRFEGRRHRSGHLYEEPQDPPTRGGWQRDVNTHDRLTRF